MEIHFYSSDLQFRHPFHIAAGTRNTTAVVYVEISLEGMTGYGEAALPPYLPETTESVIAFLRKVEPSRIDIPLSLEQSLSYIRSVENGNQPAKAALDMALHDLYGKLNGISIHRLWVSDTPVMPMNTFTIGMDSPEVLAEKIAEAKDFHLLKVKLGGNTDQSMMKAIRTITTKKICVDANQGWKDEYEALDKIRWLAEMDVEFVEQPLHKTDKKKQAWLRKHSPLTLIGDESIQDFQDLEDAGELFHGINIKLMKCGGLQQAHRMILRAKKERMKILLGCMSESSCGIGAAAQLAPFADWTDLDGPLLITNDPFTGVSYRDGRLIMPSGMGTGVKKRNE